MKIRNKSEYPQINCLMKFSEKILSGFPRTSRGFFGRSFKRTSRRTFGGIFTKNFHETSVRILEGHCHGFPRKFLEECPRYFRRQLGQIPERSFARTSARIPRGIVSGAIPGQTSNKKKTSEKIVEVGKFCNVFSKKLREKLKELL